MSLEIKFLCRAWASPSRLLEGEPFAPLSHSLVVTTDASIKGWGGSSSSTSCVRGVVEDRGLDSLHLLRVEDGASHFSVPRVSCRGSFGSDSFSLFDRSVLHLLSGRESLLVPVLADLGPVGMVSSKDNLPSDGSHSRRREFCGGLPFQGEVSSFGVVSEPLRFQNIFPVSSPPPEIVLFASACNFRLP